MFPFKLFTAIQGSHSRQVNFFVQAFHKAKNGHLSGLARLEMALTDRHDIFQAAEQGMPVGKGIQRTHSDHGFQRTPAHLTKVYTAGKVIDVLELPTVRAGFGDQIDRVLADVLDSAQTETNNGLPIPGVFNFKIPTAVIHVRRQNIDAHGAAVGHIKRDFFGFVFDLRQQRGHILNGIVCFQESGLHRHDPIIRRVALIEAVMRKTLPIHKNLIRRFLINAAFNRAIDEFFVVFL